MKSKINLKAKKFNEVLVTIVIKQVLSRNMKLPKKHLPIQLEFRQPTLQYPSQPLIIRPNERSLRIGVNLRFQVLQLRLVRLLQQALQVMLVVFVMEVLEAVCIGTAIDDLTFEIPKQPRILPQLKHNKLVLSIPLVLQRQRPVAVFKPLVELLHVQHLQVELPDVLLDDLAAVRRAGLAVGEGVPPAGK